MRNLELICILSFLFPVYISGQIPVQQADPEIGIIEKLEDTIPADLQLTDHNGNKVLLGEIVDNQRLLHSFTTAAPGSAVPLWME